MTDVVNVGSGKDTKDGDDARDGAVKINAKFAALDASIAGLGAPLVSSTFSAFNAAATLDGTESVPLVQAAANVKTPLTALGRRFGFVNQITLSTQPNIDTTGVSDSWAGFTTAYALSLSTGKPLVVDCKCKLVIGTDNTKCIFIRSNTNIQGTPCGVLIVDNVYLPAFVFHHTQDFMIKDLNIQYAGAGAPWDDTIAPYPATRVAFNDTTMKNDMAANFGNTFSGAGSSLPVGHTNPMSVIRCIGNVSRGMFQNVKIYVAQGTNAAQFAPVAFSIDPQWTPNTLVTTTVQNSTPSAANAVLPNDFDILNCRMDGVYMGIVGSGGVRITNLVSVRYSDLQKSDGTGGGGNLAYFAPPHLIYLADPDPTFTNWQRKITDTFDYGIYVGGATRRGGGSGSLLSLKIAPCQNTVVDGYVSMRPDGFADILTNQFGNQFGSLKNLYYTYDSSTLTADSNNIWGCRFPSAAPYNYLSIDGLVGRDVNPTPVVFPIVNMTNVNNLNCDFKGIKMYLNQWPAGNTGYPGFALSGNNMSMDADYYFNSYDAEQTFRGSFCMQGSSLVTNSDVNIRLHGYRLFPVVFAGVPSGTSGTLATNWTHSTGLYLIQFSTNDVRYATLTNGATTCTWAATGGGAFTPATLASVAITSTVGDFSCTATTLVVGTPVTIAGTLGGTGSITGYANPTTYMISATNGTTTFNLVTVAGAQITTTAGTPTGLTYTLASPIATAQNGLAANYSGYKQRMLSMQGGKGVGNHIRIMDCTNGLESIHHNGVVSEHWSQNWTGTPPAGTTFTLPMAIPATHNPDLFSVSYVTSLGTSAGLTSWALGWAATPAALLNTISPSIASTVAAAGAITTNAGTLRTLLMTATGGTGFDGTGVVTISVRSSSAQGAG